jgi:trehalose/maltose hydrolase-like predicted phosphorylase
MDAIGTGSTIIGHQLQLALTAQTPITVEKVATVASSRDRAISTPAEAACFQLQQAGDFSELLLAQERAWMQLWDDFAVTAAAASPTGLALNLHTFHVATAEASIDLDAGIAARGLHREGYRGHVFWDEAFVYPLLTLRRPQLTRDLLAYGIGGWMLREPPPAPPVCPGPFFRGSPAAMVATKPLPSFST